MCQRRAAHVCVLFARACVCACIYTHGVYQWYICYVRVYAWKTVEEQRETMTETADPAAR